MSFQPSIDIFPVIQAATPNPHSRNFRSNLPIELDLIAQARSAGEQAFADGDLTKKQRHFLNKNLDSSEELYNIMGADAHEVARWTLGKACDAVSE